jgi:transposase
LARYCTSFPDDNYLFQDDNVPVHMARVVKEYMEDTDLHGIKWPSHSPDPNIIENAWHKIKKELQKQVQSITSVVGNCYSQHMD